MKTLVEFLNESLDKNIKDLIKLGMRCGYVIMDDEHGKPVKYGISRENIFNLQYDEKISIDEIKKYVDELEKDGVKFRFEKDEEWKDSGLKDPNED